MNEQPIPQPVRFEPEAVVMRDALLALLPVGFKFTITRWRVGQQPRFWKIHIWGSNRLCMETTAQRFEDLMALAKHGVEHWPDAPLNAVLATMPLWKGVNNG